MNRTALVASLALALASSMFASATFAQDQDPAAPASSTSSDATNDQPANAEPSDPSMAPKKRMHRHRMRHESNAEAAVNGDDPKEAQYQMSNRVKSYPAVDHGHVAGDPPVIDHSGDQAPVANPTHTAIAVPPNHG